MHVYCKRRYNLQRGNTFEVSVPIRELAHDSKIAFFKNGELHTYFLSALPPDESWRQMDAAKQYKYRMDLEKKNKEKLLRILQRAFPENDLTALPSPYGEGEIPLAKEVLLLCDEDGELME